MLDVVVLSPEKGDALLIRREGPYERLWTLPGKFARAGEKLEEAAAQIAKDEAGLNVQDMRLVGVYSDPDHDLRGHDASCTFLAAG